MPTAQTHQLCGIANSCHAKCNVRYAKRDPLL